MTRTNGKVKEKNVVVVKHTIGMNFAKQEVIKYWKLNELEKKKKKTQLHFLILLLRSFAFSFIFISSNFKEHNNEKASFPPIFSLPKNKAPTMKTASFPPIFSPPKSKAPILVVHYTKSHLINKINIKNPKNLSS